MIKNKLVLVTGAAGFIGSRVSQLLLDQGYQVVGIDSLNDAYDITIKEHRLEKLKHRENFQFFQMTIETQGSVNYLFKEYSFATVFHLAARAGVRYSLQNPHVYMTTNTMGTLNILEAMRKSGVKKIVMASTSSLYAGQEMPFSEETPTNKPLTVYASSKKAAEALCYSYNHLYGIDVSIVRYFTVYGPAGRPDMCIFRFIKWIDEEKPIELFGDGEQSRNFTYIDDIARGTISASKDFGYETINLGGSGKPVSLNNIIRIIESSLGKKAKIEYKPFHKADIFKTMADTTKAKELLDWTPREFLKTGISKTIDWYLENKKWVKDVRL